MNGDFAVDQARFLAERVAREAGTDLRAQVRLAWRLAFAVTPRDAELDDALGFIANQRAFYDQHPVAPAKVAKGRPDPLTDPALLALANFCHALLSSNRFLYVN